MVFGSAKRRNWQEMVHLTRINHSPLILNSDLIEHVQSTPDTVITLTNGHNYLVLESPDEVVNRVVGFRRRIHGGPVRVMAAGSILPEGEDCNG